MTNRRPAIELPLPATMVEEVLTALIVRDLLHGSSYDVEVEDDGREFEVDLTVTDEIDEENGVYLALVEIEYGGDVDEESLGAFLTQIIDEAAAEAEQIVEKKREIAVCRRKEIEFRAVDEDAERWDLVIPDWLAPEDSVVPFGFRPFLVEGGAEIPSNAQLDEAGRIVVVPMAEQLHFFAVPAPEEESCGG